MDDKRLRALLTAVQCGSFGKATAQLGYTQSAMTHMVNKLEAELGCTLLTRSSHGVRLSEEGEHLGYEVSGRAFEFYTVPADNLDGLHSRLPSDIPCQWSGNNAGGVVVTLWRKAG